MIKIQAIGGYSEVGRNMTLVSYKEESIIFDMGVHMENYIHVSDEDNDGTISVAELEHANALPDDSMIKNKDRVIAIVPSHGHLDHIGAIPYLAQKYNCPIICTPYTAAVIRSILKDKDMSLPNEIIVVNIDQKIKVSDNMAIEFVNMTHSIPDTATVVLHTPEGSVVYSNDFKLDDTPTLGKKPNYERLTELGNSGKVKALILDSLYAHLDRHTPSESSAKEKLKEVMFSSKDDDIIIVSTFSSHIARLKSIVEFGMKLNRKVVFMGRSLARYVYAANDANIMDFSGLVEIVPYKKQMKKKLKEIEKFGKKKYVVACTGHQGEPGAVLSAIADHKLGIRLKKNDVVIFSCTVIPSETNEQNRLALEYKLEKDKVKIYKDIHESGHASRKDHDKLIDMLRPKHVIPAHAETEKKEFIIKLCEGKGYKKGKTVHLIGDSESIDV